MDSKTVYVLSKIIACLNKEELGMIPMTYLPNSSSSAGEGFTRFAFTHSNLFIAYVDIVLGEKDTVRINFGEGAIEYGCILSISETIHKSLVKYQLEYAQVELLNLITQNIISNHVEDILFYRSKSVILTAIKMVSGIRNISNNNDINYKDVVLNSDGSEYAITLVIDDVPEAKMTVEIVGYDKFFIVQSPDVKIQCPDSTNSLPALYTSLANKDTITMVKLLGRLLSFYTVCWNFKIWK